MKLAQQVKKLSEALGSSDLDKFWSAVKEHCFKNNARNKQESTLLLSSDAANFETAAVSNIYINSDKLDDQIESSLEVYFKTNLKDLLAFVYNEYVADKDASSDVDDNKLVEFFLSKIKGEKLEFEASTEVLFTDSRDDRSNSSADYDISGELVVDEFDYDKNKDVFELYKPRNVKLKTVEQR
jgi:hypothetical protein